MRYSTGNGNNNNNGNKLADVASDLNKENINNSGNVVVEEACEVTSEHAVRMLVAIGMTPISLCSSLVKKYGHGRVAECILAAQTRAYTNIPGYVRAALEGNWNLHPGAALAHAKRESKRLGQDKLRLEAIEKRQAINAERDRMSASQSDGISQLRAALIAAQKQPATE